MDDLTKEQRTKNMRHIRSKNTKIEVILRKALWHSGIRYRIYYDKLPGKPDIVITKYRIAIFCDGEFFHGKDWTNLQCRLKKSHNSDYWTTKIHRNILRDREVTHEIEALGWTVIRLWGKEILKNTNKCVSLIRKVITSKKQGSDEGDL